jgi:hypothetical protein
METRSQRQAAQQQRPPYPQVAAQSAPTSPSASVFQSSSSLASIAALNNTGAFAHQMPGMLQTQQGLASAPLPSPSGTQPATYFGSLAQSAPTSHPSQQQQRMPQPQNVAGTYLGQRGDGGGTPETAPFLKDFNLVAEAAKRAQVACLTRDMGDIGL